MKKVALVHDWLISIGGAEKVLKEFHELFPQAPIYVLFHNPDFTRDFLPDAEIRCSNLQETYELFGGHKFLMPFLPLAVESLNLDEFDLVISTAQFAKGLILKPKTFHINYCASPLRQIWDWQAEYRNERYNQLFTSLFQHGLRLWDSPASGRVDSFIANSINTQNRIKKYYGRGSKVIYPPIERQPRQTGLFHDPNPVVFPPSTYYLIVSRLFAHKNIHLAVKAFSKLELPLVIVGDGPELNRLRRLANLSADIVFLGPQTDEQIDLLYDNCKAFIMPQEEDFGITPIEAMSHGKPVVALARGGALEYIKPGINGELFEDPTEEMLADGVRRLIENYDSYNPKEIKKTTEQFGQNIFKKEINEYIRSHCAI